VVDINISVEQSHDLTDHLEGDLNLEFPRACVTIHVEPDTGDNTKKPRLCEIPEDKQK
jgi:divalent metal cation (Fe/Co/Zn/Cd) transporter